MWALEEVAAWPSSATTTGLTLSPPHLMPHLMPHRSPPDAPPLPTRRSNGVIRSVLAPRWAVLPPARPVPAGAQNDAVVRGIFTKLLVNGLEVTQRNDKGLDILGTVTGLSNE
ncbi:hypothetical protein ABIB25_004037 [Nakamurella sp. UYEF19]